MADDTGDTGNADPNADPNAGGDPTGDGGGAGDAGAGVEGESFSKQQVESIIKQRLAAERKRFADYQDLKAKASKFDELEAANLSELEKVSKAKDEADKRAQQAEERAARTLVRAALVSEATKQGAVDPDAVFAFLSSADLKPDDDGEVPGAAEAVRKLLDSKPYLKGNRVTGDAGGGARGRGSDMSALGSMDMDAYLEATGRKDAFSRIR